MLLRGEHALNTDEGSSRRRHSRYGLIYVITVALSVLVNRAVNAYWRWLRCQHLWSRHANIRWFADKNAEQIVAGHWRAHYHHQFITRGIILLYGEWRGII